MPAVFCTGDHSSPRGLDISKGLGAVIEGVVNQDEVGPMREHVRLEASRSCDRIFASNRGGDDIGDSGKIAVSEVDPEEVRVGLERFHPRRGMIPRRHAVTVEDDVDGAIVRPRFLQLRVDG